MRVMLRGFEWLKNGSRGREERPSQDRARCDRHISDIFVSVEILLR